MPVHRPINRVVGKQRRTNSSISKEIGPMVIFIAESFLDIFMLSFSDGLKL
jgi:hypothetical protein